MRHFEALGEKIVEMETRHRLREQQLQRLIHESSIADVTSRWRAVVDEKNRDIDRFRTELDAILEVLRQLQTDGVVTPHCGSVQ